MKKFLALSLSDFVFIVLINVKMPTIVGILTFKSRINFVLSWVEHEKKFISGSSRRLTLKKGAPGDQVCDLLCVQLASYLEGGPLMWMMCINKKSDYDYDH